MEKDQNLRALLEEIRITNGDREFTRKVFKETRNYCKKRNFNLSEEDMDTIKIIGLENWIEDWKEGVNLNCPAKKEYRIEVWGGAWNVKANPSIEKDYGISEGVHYFKTEEERDSFLKIINEMKYRSQGLMDIISYGYMKHKKTVFVGNFEYKNQSFIVRYDFGYDYARKSAIKYFTLGTCACDCARSALIRSIYGKDAMPDLACGSKIKLVKYQIMYES